MDSIGKQVVLSLGLRIHDLQSNGVKAAHLLTLQYKATTDRYQDLVKGHIESQHEMLEYLSRSLNIGIRKKLPMIRWLFRLLLIAAGQTKSGRSSDFIREHPR